MICFANFNFHKNMIIEINKVVVEKTYFEYVKKKLNYWINSFQNPIEQIMCGVAGNRGG